jgi:hypothetical protein
LAEKFSEVGDELHQNINIDRASQWCIFLKEDFLHRLFIVRERLKDILYNSLEKPSHKRKHSAKEITAKLNVNYPTLAPIYTLLQDKIESDVPLRNKSVHETILMPATMIGDSKLEHLWEASYNGCDKD